MKDLYLKDSCDFCREIQGQPCYFNKIYQDELLQRVVYHTKNFVVIPTIGQIVPGYLLIVPKIHICSIGSLSAEMISDLEEVMAYVRSTIFSAYGVYPVFFEHGVPDGNSVHGGCGIYHLHLHAVPLGKTINLLDDVTQDFAFEKLPTLSALQGIAAVEKSYLFFVDADGNKYVSRNKKIPSQYFRIKLARKLGEEKWDWRIYAREEHLLSTYNKFLCLMGNDCEVFKK